MLRSLTFMKTKHTTETILDAVEQQLRRFHLDYLRLPHEPVISFEFELQGVTWDVRAFVTESLPTLHVVAASPVVVRPACRQQVTRLLDGINARANFGCFFLSEDEEDAHVTLRNTLPVLPGADLAAASHFAISVCGSAFHQLGASLAAASLVAMDPAAFLRELDEDSEPDAPGESPDRQGVVGLN